ncbi:MAG: outer membrane beta-barrel protein [Saprospiraceae bacterium]|nr:outer membrane beta-barrel protein [Saprospiraceae bacterium]
MLKFKKLFVSVIVLFVFAVSSLHGQILQDLKIKLSAGLYGLVGPTNQYSDEYNYKPSINYSLGLVKNFNLNNSGSWLLGTEILYNRTNIKVGLEDQMDHFKLDQLLIPVKLMYRKNNLKVFVGLVNSFNFETKIKEYDSVYFRSVGSFGNVDNSVATLLKDDFIDKTFSLQYCLGFEISNAKGNSIGLEFIDYFGFRNYYRKLFNSSYYFQQISSSTLNFYVNFNINKP